MPSTKWSHFCSGLSGSTPSSQSYASRWPPRKPGRDSPGCRCRLRWGAAGPHFGWMILGLNELNNVRKRSGERQPLVFRLLTGFLSQQDNTLWSPGMIISDKNYRGFLFSVTGETSNFTDRFFSWINDWLNTWVSLRIMETIIMTRWNKFNTAQNLSVYSIYRPYTRYTSRYITDPMNYQQEFSSFKYLWWPVDTDE